MPSFEISGHLVSRLEKVEGQSQKGPWVKQEFVIETLDKDYPKKISLTAWGETTNALKGLKKNDILKLSFSAESREHNGRWYTELRAFKIELTDAPAAPQPTARASGQRQPAKETSRDEFAHHNYDDDSSELPF